MATFEAQVEGLTSLSIDGSSAPTQTELTQFLTDGAKEIINILPSDKLDWCSSQQTFTSVMPGSEAETLNTGKVLRVYRNDGDYDRPCRRITPDKKGYVIDPDEMEYASMTDPVYYTENNKINVLPQGGACKYDEVQYPAVAYTDSAISVFPDEAEYLVTLYASLKSLQNKMGSKYSDLPSDISLPSLPVSPAVPSISNLSISTAISSAPSAPSFSTGAISMSGATAPTYTKPTFVAPALDDIGNMNLPVAPSAPSDPSFTTPSISSVTAEDTVIGAMPTINETRIANLGTAPSYTPPAITTSGSDSTSVDLSKLDTASWTALDYDFDDENIDPLKWFQTLGDMIQNQEDVELANAQMQKISTYVNAYGQAMTNRLNVFNKENAEYQAKLQEAIQQAQLNSSRIQQEATWNQQRTMQQAQTSAQTRQSQSQIDSNKAQQEASLKLQKEQQEYQSELSKYSSQLQSYQADVNKEVQRWTNEELNKKMQIFQNKYSNRLQEYSTNIQNELNEFNKENTVFRNQLDEEIQEAQNQQSKDSNEYNAKLQKYSNEITAYQAQVNTSVQEYTNNLQADMQEYQQKLAKYSNELQSYQADFSSKLQNYTAKIQKHTTDYQWLGGQYQQLAADYQRGLQMIQGS